MKVVLTDKNIRKKQVNSKKVKAKETLDSKVTINEDFSKSIREAVKNEFKSEREKKQRKYCEIFFVIVFTVILLFVQAIFYNDLKSIEDILTTIFTIAEAIFVLNSKRIKKRWRLKFITFTMIKKIVTLVLIATILSTICWQIPVVKAIVSDSTLSILDLIKRKVESNSAEVNNEETETTTKRISQYNPNMTFKINYYDKSPELCYAMFEQIYFYVNDNAEVESILKHFNEIYGIKASKNEEKEFFQIQSKEDEFISKMQISSNYKDKHGVNDEWYELLPHENELLEIIRRQKEYAENYPGYIILLRLSNNYQRLAQQYLYQDASKSTVKYYYYMSLIYDYECIKYADNEEQLNSSLSRVYYRFRDIVSYCETTDMEKAKATLVLEGLKDYEY